MLQSRYDFEIYDDANRFLSQSFIEVNYLRIDSTKNRYINFNINFVIFDQFVIISQ